MNRPSIPYISSTIPLSESIEPFLDQLAVHDFRGDIDLDLARRLVGATDNSVYQLLPQAILYPRIIKDIELVMHLLAQEEFRVLNITPRGGGTGTNGQSLTTGISLDLSRYLNQIIEINLKEKWVEVEAGVVLDQLNDALKSSGYFFAPNLSPSSRATIGGMINTDAAGKGSRVYGKTSDHIIALDLICIGGETERIEPIQADVIREGLEDKGHFTQRIMSPLLTLAEDKRETIDEIFPKLSRFMTGYNLKMLYDQDKDILDLTRLIAGSEGTLGVVTKSRLKLTPIPTHRRLILLSYGTFQDALGSAQLLLDQTPSAIETIDHNILTLARADASYHEIKEILEGNGVPPDKVMAINLVEFEGHSEEEVKTRVDHCLDALRPTYGAPNTPIADVVAVSEQDQKGLWSLRKKGVGLLASRPGKRKPIAFVEDTVVPPEKLSAYIKDFTQLLDREGVEYGLFGHVDVGCLHVRPALDLRQPEDEMKFLRISDQVSELVKSYGGLIWGEHGKGIRSAYSPDYFGKLYPVLQEVKSLFDPFNQLNPGKVATPNSQHELLPLASPLRAHRDRLITDHNLAGVEASVTCNGNGQCFDYHPDHLMCPSAKVTRDRLHSPKGRAGVMRAWLTALSERDYQIDQAHFDPLKIKITRGSKRIAEVLVSISKAPFTFFKKQLNQRDRGNDFSNQVHEAMSGCLSCKACATACPVKVDVPSFKARFLNLFYQRYPRPLRDYLIGSLERLAYLGSFVPWLWNLSIENPLVKVINQQVVGLVDPPHLSSRSALKTIRRLGGRIATPSVLAGLSKEDRQRSVILIPDAFTSFFDAESMVHTYELLKAFNINVLIAPFYPNGKGLHIKGRLSAFKRTAENNVKQIKVLKSFDIPMVCLDPAVALTYRDEYVEAMGVESQLPILMIQEWLSTQLHRLPKDYLSSNQKNVSLFAHCTERSLSSTATEDWFKIFEHLGINCQIESVGCCGMCGVYGHEAEHRQLSQQIFESSWAIKLNDCLEQDRPPLITGYSCRAQVKRYGVQSSTVQHPLSEIFKRLKNEQQAQDTYIV
jgi:FAD/FMN-containing dehydrogenase/Fe-S oxidoreductase